MEKKGSDLKMELAGYNAEKVADIIGHMNIEENEIKTTSVVACEVGSDEAFRNTLLKELHARSIETELHLRSSLLQVSHSGQKYTAEITPNGMVWKHFDDSKKIVVKVDRNGEVVTQVKPGNHAEATYLNERNILGDNFIDSWPEEPNKFVSEGSRQVYTDELEGLAWAFFHHRKNFVKESVLKMHPVMKNNDKYTINHLKVELVESPPHQSQVRQNRQIHITEGPWHTSEDSVFVNDILNKCYEITSGVDILNLITYYAAFGEKQPTYLMLNDWIYKILEKTMYIFPVGKRLKGKERIEDIQNIIKEQFNKHKYDDIRKGIKNCLGAEHEYAKYAKASLQGVDTRSNFNPPLSLNQEAWYSTMFLALVIPESSRNFRSFPITLMAIDIAQTKTLKQQRKVFLFYGSIRCRRVEPGQMQNTGDFMGQAWS